MNIIPSELSVAPLRHCERFLLTLVVLAITFTSASAEKHTKQHRTSDAPFLKPAEAVAKMEIPEGFDVSIFAAEPDIGEPIAFTFDGRGRIWVVENGQLRQPPFAQRERPTVTHPDLRGHR